MIPRTNYFKNEYRHVNEHRVIVGKILTTVSNKTGITIPEMECKTRKREVVQARCISMNLLLKYTDMSLKSIGYVFGNRDHSTVIHARDNHDDFYFTKDKSYVKMFEACDEALTKEEEPVINPS